MEKLPRLLEVNVAGMAATLAAFATRDAEARRARSSASRRQRFAPPGNGAYCAFEVRR